ncbi:hypothetical protein AMECASPLE_026012 [Ameca splendens]|uniref:Uncharacterized protein n=1 Tax=Ameca splendens TaxID=208324 RepID=A0ABV0Z2Q5_9TELE
MMKIIFLLSTGLFCLNYRSNWPSSWMQSENSRWRQTMVLIGMDHTDLMTLEIKGNKLKYLKWSCSDI